METGSPDPTRGGAPSQPSHPRLVNLPEPHATLLELFLSVRGNMKDMERELGLAYSTVRSRLDEAFNAVHDALGGSLEDRQNAVLRLLEHGDIDTPEALRRLRALRNERSQT